MSSSSPLRFTADAHRWGHAFALSASQIFGEENPETAASYHLLGTLKFYHRGECVITAPNSHPKRGTAPLHGTARSAHRPVARPHP